MPTSSEGAFRKASGDGLIDPLAKMGDIPPTSISIKPLRLEAFQDLLLFLFQGEPRKIYRQLMVSGRKALLEYIKSTYWRRESLPCELDCFCFKLSVAEKGWTQPCLKTLREIRRRFKNGKIIDRYESRKKSIAVFLQLDFSLYLTLKLISASLKDGSQSNQCWSQLERNVKRVNCELILQFLPKSLGLCLLVSTSSNASGDAGQTIGSNLCFGASPGAGEPSPRPVINERYDEPREPQIPRRVKILWRRVVKESKYSCALEPQFISTSFASSSVLGVQINHVIL